MHTYAARLTRGMCVTIEGWPYVVVYSECVKYGKGPVFVHVELRDAVSDITRKIRLHPMKRLEGRKLVTKWMHYLQSNDDNHVFSDRTTGDQADVPGDLLGGDAQWLEKDAPWKLVYLDGELFAAVPLLRG